MGGGEARRKVIAVPSSQLLNVDMAVTMAGHGKMKNRAGQILQWMVKTYRIWLRVIGVEEEAQ